MSEQEKEILEAESAEETNDEAEEMNDEAPETAETVEEEPIEAAEAEASNEESSKEKKGLGKKKKTDKKTEAYEARIAELDDRVMRQMAEFENFRKRTEKEKATMFEMGAKSVIEKILPVVDNFERGLQAIPKEDENSPFAEGMNKIYKQMMTELEGLGVKPIEAVGREFNPNFHNAVMQVESDEYEEGVIAQELLKGYTYRDTVVRYSMVAVTQ